MVEIREVLRRWLAGDGLPAIARDGVDRKTIAKYVRAAAAVGLQRGQAIVIDPAFWIGHFLLAQAAERLQEDDLALAELEHAARLSGGNSKMLGLRGYLLATRGRADEARDVLRTIESISASRYLPPCAAALVHAGLGDGDAAFAWLERAYAARDVHLVYLRADPKWERLRAARRFAALLERCGF